MKQRTPLSAKSCGPPITTALPAAAETLRGRSRGDAAAVAAAWRADPQDDIDAADDHTGSADYKRHLADELTQRALRRSVARITGEDA